MDIFKKVELLHLSAGEYVVVASGVMEAIGLRKAADLDIAVTPLLFDQLRKNSGWKEEVRWDKLFLIKNGIDIIPELAWSAYSTTTKEVIASAMIINGIPFMNLEELCKFKHALGREKDFADVALIEEYIRTHEKKNID